MALPSAALSASTMPEQSPMADRAPWRLAGVTRRQASDQSVSSRSAVAYAAADVVTDMGERGVKTSAASTITTGRLEISW